MMTFLPYLKGFRVLLSLALLSAFLLSSEAKDKDKKKQSDEKENSAAIYSGLKWRSIGPAMTSGRIADFAVNPETPAHWYVAVASGHVWKTTNNGTTFKPVFDGQGSYSIGVVTMDPNNHNVIWVGTGENNHQRALGYGDGVYKSEDGGKSWSNMGLKDSRQIGGIVVDPRNSDIVFVAAEGSAWGPGGDRGLYRTADGGETWEKVLEISEQTGVNNVIIDPVDPDVMYATSEQRRRHVHTKIGGGPESAVYRSDDGGLTWEKSMKGLPSVHIGGMGIAVSPADHNVLYLILEAARDKSGFYRSVDRGASWEKMSDHNASGQYYNEIYCDPVDVNKVYSMETVSKVSEDGGRTWKNIGNDNRHVDDHALWIDPAFTGHMLIGGDGGVYETFDGGKSWQFKTNLPVTQFYRVNVDNEFPFYNVYGGTQDNNTLTGPSQNFSRAGVTSEEWKAIRGGDGFWVGISNDDPNFVYTEYQYGNVYRYDKASGEEVNIKPRPRKDEETYKWNWNAPLVVSKHSPTRIYIMANKLFRSENRGNAWEVISEDLTSGVDRNTWPVMDKYWSSDAVRKDVSTSLFGTGVSFSESPLDENLLYAGTDDGVLSITEDGGKTWRKVKQFEGIPGYTYISDILSDKHNRNTVYVTFDNRKRDDFRPYILKSTDAGKSWETISSNLPENGTVHTIEQDSEVSSLLFAGTEFGFFFSLNGGDEWIRLKSGMPSAIAVRDMAIQERENDIVLATFGRGFYVLDDYTPLREMASQPGISEKEAHIFEIPDAKMYIQTGGKYGQGTSFFKAKNPGFGAVFTYYMKEVPETLEQERIKKEEELFEAGEPIPQPSREQLLAEENEIDPYLVFSVYDQEGNTVRRLTKSPAEGIQRITWDLRLHYPRPERESRKVFKPADEGPGGILCMPGVYRVSMDLVTREGVRRLVEPVTFNTELLRLATLQAEDREEVIQFQEELTELTRVFLGMEKTIASERETVEVMLQTALHTPGVPMETMEELKALRKELKEIQLLIDGPAAQASWEELPPMDMPLGRRLSVAVRTHWNNTAGITQTVEDQFDILKAEFPPLLERVGTAIAERERIDRVLEESGAAWTPGRVPVL